MSIIPPPQTICYVAAKSGGHIMPALTLATQEKSRNAATRILFVSSACELDKKILDNARIVDRHLAVSLYKNNAKSFLNYLYTPINILRIFIESLLFFWQERPQEVVSMGGLISVPVCFAALCMRIPFDIWELNAVPGKAVALLKSFARSITICFKESSKALFPWKCRQKPYPVRFDTTVSKSAARKALNISTSKKVVLILGGSQGSSFMNNDLANIIVTLCNDEWFIIHQAGLHAYEMVQKKYKEKNLPSYVFNFTPDIAACYAAADFVIARAGAGTIFEILAFKKRALLIPLQAKSTDHQVDNARAITQEYPELFNYCEQHALTPTTLKEFLIIEE